MWKLVMKERGLRDGVVTTVILDRATKMKKIIEAKV